MKNILLFLCLSLALSAYNRDKAYNYAKKYWSNYNTPTYANYNPDGGDCANFVSQCLIAGGLNLVKMCGSGAAWGKGGTVPNVSAMRTCLTNNGWVATSKIPSNFKKGDVILYPGHAVIAVSDYPHVTYAAHNNDRWAAQVYYNPTPTFFHYNGATTNGGSKGGNDDGCQKTCNPARCVTDVANDVIAGKYGNGNTRVNKLTAEGCDASLVQDEVNRILS